VDGKRRGGRSNARHLRWLGPVSGQTLAEMRKERKKGRRQGAPAEPCLTLCYDGAIPSSIKHL